MENKYMNLEPSCNFNNPYSDYYTPIQLILPLDCSLIIDASDPVYTLDEVLRKVDLGKYLVSSYGKDRRGPKGYNPFTLLEVILFGYTLKGSISLREIEDLCKNDIRFRWILRYERKAPTFMTLANFINNGLKANITDIFNEINTYIFNKDNVDLDHVYIDGTKIEANANKYTWVWKQACITNRDKLYVKITDKLNEINQEIASFNIKFQTQSVYPISYMEMIFQRYINLFNINPDLFVYGKGQRKDNHQRNYEFLDEAIKRLKDYENKINICGPHRNSYSKTDYGATFMRTKTDYMGNDQLLPSYNVQFGISDEYISILDVNQFASDQDCFIPLMDKFYKTYHFYPTYPIADAGYGSLKNYYHCEKTDMEKYMKYPMYEKETKDKKYQKNPFKSINFKINENGNPVCPRGKEFIKISQKRILNLDKDRYEEKYACTDCFRCHFKSKCTKAKGNRTITLNRTLTKYHDEVKHNLLSIHGALLLMNRTILSEGAFGILKYDRGYKRITRRGLVSVNMELTLIAIGYNIKKLHNKIHRIK